MSVCSCPAAMYSPYTGPCGPPAALRSRKSPRVSSSPIPKIHSAVWPR